MAQKAKKDRAKSNITTLNSLHIGSLTANVVFLLFSLLIRRRSLLVYFILSLPAFISQFVLERSGRPSFDPTTKALKKSGEDLAAPGLTEYMFDTIWITWASLLAVILLGNWGWMLWTVVPAYGLYKGYGLLGMAKGLMGGGQGQQMPEEQMPTNRKQRRAA